MPNKKHTEIAGDTTKAESKKIKNKIREAKNAKKEPRQWL